MKDKIGAIYRGKSLCIEREHVKKISSIFEKMNKNFYVFVIKQNASVRKKRERRNRKNGAHSCTTVEYTTAFKPITEEQIQ